MQRKLIELLIDEANGAFGVEAISLVSEPAIEVNWVAFNKQGRTQAIHLAALDEEQRTIVGPALIPDLKIVRFDKETDEEYDVFFSKETIKQASELYLKTHRTNNHTFEHAEPVEGVHVVESWLVQDPKVDKASLYGFGDIAEGTWMVRAKVENDEVWQKIKAGEARGLSIEGYFIDSVVSMGKAKKAKKDKTMLQAIYDAVVRKFYKEATLSNGTTLVTESDEFAAGVAVYTLDDEGSPMDIDNGKYTTEKGVELEVFDGVLIEYDGQVQAIEEAATPAPEAAPAAPVDLGAMKTAYYKALLKQRYLTRSAKNTTLSAMKLTTLSANRHAQKVVAENLDIFGDNGDGLYHAITEIALEVFPELDTDVYNCMIDAADAAEAGDMDKTRDHLVKAYDYADREVQGYIDALLTAVGTIEQYS